MKVLWYRYEMLLMALIDKVKKHDFDQIVCIGRGGFLVGDALSRALDIPLAVIMAQSYFKLEKQVLKFSRIASLLPLEGDILLVDDLVDTGDTLFEIKKSLYEYDEIKIVQTGVIWKKKDSKFIPDYYVEDIDSNEWIDQPFEIFNKA